MAETKYAATTSNNWTYFNSEILGTNQFSAGLPTILQGDDEHERVGDSILPKRNQVKVMFRLTPQDLPAPQQLGIDARDVYIVVYYGFVRKYKSISDVSAASTTLAAQLLDVGDGTTKPFMGNLDDLLYQTNGQVFNMKKKVIRLFKGEGHGNVNQGHTSAATQPPALYSKLVTLSFKHKSKIKYAGNASLYPEDYAPVWTVGFVYADGYLPPETGGTSPVQFLAQNQLWYTDM